MSDKRKTSDNKETFDGRKSFDRSKEPEMQGKVWKSDKWELHTNMASEY
jgi:hypothetical protein